MLIFADRLVKQFLMLIKLFKRTIEQGTVEHLNDEVEV